MRQAIKPRCRYGCRFLDITPGLSLCPHTAVGWASNLKGAVEEARRMLEREGGYDVVLARVVAQGEEKKASRRRLQVAAPAHIREDRHVAPSEGV